MLEDPGSDVRPEAQAANVVLNDVIREYLQFNGYNHTLSVFTQEASCGAEPLPRSLLAQQTRLPTRVGSGSARQDLPLLYALQPSPSAQPHALR